MQCDLREHNFVSADNYPTVGLMGGGCWGRRNGVSGSVSAGLICGSTGILCRLLKDRQGRGRKWTPSYDVESYVNASSSTVLRVILPLFLVDLTFILRGTLLTFSVVFAIILCVICTIMAIGLSSPKKGRRNTP